MAHIRIDIGRGGRAPKPGEADAPQDPRRKPDGEDSHADPPTKKARPD